ncbi:MAG: hypothetical protein NT013_14945 [Planctomycetia bacterium]|nr:hypothetical protein [Planctomycetia bacterium]
MRTTILFCLVVSFWTIGAPAFAAPLELAIKAEVLDEAATQMWRDGEVVPDKVNQLQSVLGVTNVVPNYIGWNAGRVAEEGTPSEFVYRVVFKRSVSIGSIFLTGTMRELFVLKPDAAGPGDPQDAKQWVKLDPLSRQSAGVLFTLPLKTETRAILLREKRESGNSTVHLLRLFKERLHNLVPSGFAYADHEYTPPNTKNTFAASRLVTGIGEWRNAGKNNNGFVASPPITDINPAWFVMSWENPQTLSGIWLRDNFAAYELQTFVGDDSVNPRAGTAKEWKKVVDLTEQRSGGRWIQFTKPLTTRGLRWLVTKTERPTNIPYGSDGGPQVAEIAGLHVFTDVGHVSNVPGTEHVGNVLHEKPPKVIAFDVPRSQSAKDRIVTMVIDGPEGRRVKNLIARETLKSGKQETGWNLKDETGALIPPGKYSWKAISHEPLRLSYETTVYPNTLMHAPENSPWLNGHHDSGGWLADHTPPVGCCTVGDRVFLSAYVAESGVSLIECDLQGRKKWGHHSFAAWTGPRYLASDNKSVFVGAQILNTTTDAIWTVDLDSKEVKPFLSLTPTSTRKRGLEGIAAKPGELALSIQAKENWLANAAAAEDADPASCLPLFGAKRPPRAAYELVPDPRGDFLRLFRLIQHPSGGETQFSLTYLQSPKGRGSKQHIVLAFNKPIAIGSVAFPVPQTEEYRVRLSVLKPAGKYPPNPDKDADWQAFDEQGSQPWDVIPAPPNTLTRALRVTFAKGAAAENDAVAKLLDGEKEEDPLGDGPKGTSPTEGKGNSDELKKLAGLTDDKNGWLGRLEGLKLLRRRFVSQLPKATIRVNSGEVNELGEWDAQRDRPLTESDPGIFVMQWDEPVSLRGLAIKEIDGQFTKVDVLDEGFVVASSDGAESGSRSRETSDRTLTSSATAHETDIAGRTGWTEVATYEQQRRDVANGFGGLGVINPQARYVDGYVDFGREIKTRAVRLRVVAQWKDNGQSACLGVRIDRGGGQLDAKRCHVYGVAPVSYVGGEPPVDSAVNDRIEIYSATDAKLLREVPIAQPKEIAYAPDGKLWAISGKSVIEVANGSSRTRESSDGSLSKSDRSLTTSATAITDLIMPTDLAFDRHGKLYVFDNAPERHHVRVYDASNGKLLRTIGTDGGFKPGAWNATRMGDVTAIGVDQEDQLWVVENQYWPKRVSVWSIDGTFKKELLGNTAYGGGGVLDPEDKSRLFYGSLEFEIDWKTRQSRLKNLTTLDGFNAGEMPIRTNGRMYVVTRPLFSERSVGIVYLYETDKLKLAAAIGLAIDFDPLKKPEILSKLGAPDLTKKCFVWTDRSGDGEVQPEEVRLFDRPKHVHGVSLFNRDLSAQQQSFRYTVKEFLPSGVPVYEVEDLLTRAPRDLAAVAQRRQDPGFASRNLVRFDNGNFFRLGDEPWVPEAALRPDGIPAWTYPSEGASVQALTNCGPYHPGQVVSEFGIIGHETAHTGDLGEFVVLHANHGAWGIWTADGMLVGPIFKDLRTGARSWSMKEHARGQSLDELTAGQEHFAGYFCRTKDNKYYVVAGHNHVSIAEVFGLETARRQSGEFEITPSDLLEAERWEQQQQQHEVFARAPVIDCYRVKETPIIDGKLTEWKTPDAQMGTDADFHIGYDDQTLYVAYAVRGLGPLKNSGREFDRLFKTGASVDLQFGIDPDADETRQAPVEGDKRVLMTFAKLSAAAGSRTRESSDASDGADRSDRSLTTSATKTMATKADQPKPIAVLFDALVPGTPEDKRWRVVSPVAEVFFDRVARIEGVKLAAENHDNGYNLEAAIPLKGLGLSPAPNLRLKFDWGVLSTDQDGNVVLRRRYWSNQATGIVADAPSEARLTPHLWGHIRFHGDRSSAEDKLKDLEQIAGTKKSSKEVKKDVTDILDDLDEKPVKKK